MDKREQICSAEASLIKWLERPSELGRVPEDIKFAGSFNMSDMEYHMFMFRPTAQSQWLLGVCGGYEPNSLQHCGLVWSDMAPYDKVTAEEKARKMVETIMAYWRARAENATSRN